MVIKIREKIVRKYGLKHGEKIYRKTLQEISNKEFINLSDLIFILGCHYNILYKREYNLSRINLLKEYSSREKIKLLKMDLKYLEHFGCRMYSINEIIEICTIYKVSLDDFLTYLRRKKISYYNNIEILSQNKQGLWIGDNPMLSNDFLSKHLSTIMNNIQIQAEIF